MDTIRTLRRQTRPSQPLTQYRVLTPSGPRRIDCAYPDAMVAIELDGFDPHVADRKRFDDDRARQNDLEAMGWAFRRFTWTHVTRDPWWVVWTTARAIELEPVRWR